MKIEFESSKRFIVSNFSFREKKRKNNARHFKNLKILPTFLAILLIAQLMGSFLFLFPVKEAEANGTTYYVAGDTGLDTNDGSITAPWKTIQQAADTMVAGDTVNVKGGITYTGNTSCNSLAAPEAAVVCLTISGTSDNYITYRPWPGTGRPIIDSSLYGNSGFSTKMTVTFSYVIIEGFEITSNNSMLYNNVAGINLEELGNVNNIIVRNNIIHHHNSGINMQGGLGGGTNVLIYNNTLYANTAYGLDICINPGGVVMYNNISVGNGEGFYANATPFTADYNLIWNNTDDYTNAAVAGANDINEDPLFVDALNNDFRLQKNSPAVNSGITLSEAAKDIVGIDRPQDSIYDRGAYEYYDIPVILTALSPDPTTNPTPTFTGTASTISGGSITLISYSIDSGSWTTSGVTGTSSFAIIPTALANGAHSIRVKATDSYGNSSDPTLYGTDSFTISGGGSPSGYTNPPIPGINGFRCIINNNDAKTTSRDVTLTLEAGSNVKYVAVSEKQDFSDSGFEAFAPEIFTKPFTLSLGDGLKKVYAQFMTAYNRFSDIVYDEIVLDTSVPGQTTQEQQQQTNQQEQQTPTSNLLRALSDTKVYQIINNLKHWIPNPTVFNAYGFNWSNIKVVTSEEVSKYSRAKLLRPEGDIKVYYLTEAGTVRHIPNPEVFNSYNNKWEEILTISLTEINSYPINNLIRLENGIKVFKLENYTKRWITTSQVFNRLKYDWTEIAPTNQIELDYYPERAAIR